MSVILLGNVLFLRGVWSSQIASCSSQGHCGGQFLLLLQTLDVASSPGLREVARNVEVAGRSARKTVGRCIGFHVKHPCPGKFG